MKLVEYVTDKEIPFGNEDLKVNVKIVQKRLLDELTPEEEGVEKRDKRLKAEKDEAIQSKKRLTFKKKRERK